MLKNPRATIINLPLYYYIPNFGGIVLSAKQLRIMESLCTGISNAYRLYRDDANEYQMKKWSEKFLWRFIYWAFRKTEYLKTDDEKKQAQKILNQLKSDGVFDNVPSEFFELRNKIYAYIND